MIGEINNQDIDLTRSKNCRLVYEGKSDIKSEIKKIPNVEFEKVTKLHNENRNLFNQEGDKYINSFFKGDNLIILKNLLPHLREKVDLIYIDPPFGTNQDFITYQGKSAYSDKITDEVFIEFLRKRLYLLRSFLSEKGSIYVHIDKKMGHYIKIILDEIFGEENYINEITRIKCNPKNFSRKAYGNYTDTIFFYAKNNDKHIWNNVKRDLTDKEKKRLFPKIDDDGNRYTTHPLHAPGETQNGATGDKWKGMYPPEGRHWRYNPEVLTELDDEGLIEWSSNGNPRKIVYVKDHKGKKIQDLWEFKDKGQSYVSYPTEKNSEMLDLIIKNSSKEESIVLDCFAGSGSTLIEAAKLKRNFIGIDSSEMAIKTMEENFENEEIKYNYYKIKD